MTGFFRKFSLLLISTIGSACLFSQTLPKNNRQANWQQRVNYKIQVKLDEQSQVLRAVEQIQYSNNSPDTLSYLYFHLWPNAYKNRETAFARQELLNGNTSFYFADSSERGRIDALCFTTNGDTLRWELTSHIDIARVFLHEPLLPGASVNLSTPFRVKMPKVFSRMGYEDSIFCVTQWYPKPAVYDANGWNPMPYLNQGEFYSEYGKFEVEITVPKDMVVAATGVVQDQAEINWWLSRKKEMRPHPSVESFKTLKFVQDSVHDFAWFASRLFVCDHRTVTLNNGQQVDTWMFQKYAPKRKSSGVQHIGDAVKFYSEKVGTYPYRIAQVVITPLEAGGGMEYPTITNCAMNDRTVIAHEVGHNWFYGILGSNERAYPWMDESVNTYYEERMHASVKSNDSGDTHPMSMILQRFDQTTFTAMKSIRGNEDQPGNLQSEDYSSSNYSAIVYGKNPLMFRYLQAYLGDEKFDAMMQAYYQQWKFRHPLPGDFISHVRSYTGDSLNWFFNDLLESTRKMDYKITDVSSRGITIKNKGQVKAPFPLYRLTSDSSFQVNWINGFAGKKTFTFQDTGLLPPANEPLLYFRIDHEQNTLDFYRQNNSYVARGYSRKVNGWKSQVLGNLENPFRPQLFYFPLYGYNLYNGHMAGVLLYSSLVPQKRNEFVVTPMWGFKTQSLNGYAQYWHNWYPQGRIQRIQAGLKSARFGAKGTFYNSGDPVIHQYILSAGSWYGGLSYEKIAPFVKLYFQPKYANRRTQQFVQLRYVMVNEQALDRDLGIQFMRDHYAIGELSYGYRNPHALYPREVDINFQQGIRQVGFSKLGASFTQKLVFMKGKKTASVRLFAGTFLFEKTRTPGSREDLLAGRAYFQAGARSGDNDYLYDETMIGRNERLGNIASPLNPKNTSAQNTFGRQVLPGEGGFSNFANGGSTYTFLTSANLRVPFPIPLPLGLYGDFIYWQIPPQVVTHSGVAGITTSITNPVMQLTYTGGIYVSILKNTFSMYFPLFQSSDIEGYWKTNGYETLFSRTTFMLNLNAMNPITLLRELKL